MQELRCRQDVAAVLRGGLHQEARLAVAERQLLEHRAEPLRRAVLEHPQEAEQHAVGGLR